LIDFQIGFSMKKPLKARFDTGFSSKFTSMNEESRAVVRFRVRADDLLSSKFNIS